MLKAMPANLNITMLKTQQIIRMKRYWLDAQLKFLNLSASKGSSATSIYAESKGKRIINH